MGSIMRIPMNLPDENALEVGDGLTLTLAGQPVPPSQFQVVLALEGEVFWGEGAHGQRLEPGTVWWLGTEATRTATTGTGAGRWFVLSGSRSPATDLDALVVRHSGRQTPRRLGGLEAEVRELMGVATTCNYPCELRNLLVRGKALMVVSKALHSLDTEPREPAYDVRFFHDDLEKVREARAVLLEAMTSPPTLHQLARQVGLNDLKLKAGFQKLWGTTVYGLLRQERMRAARKLLESGECNVSTAAFRVGYTNTSHFAKSFQGEFGVSPGVVARSAAS
jgi:AraC-like DNA-binding protein